MGVIFDNTFKSPAAALKLIRGHPSLPVTFKWATQIFFCYVFLTPTFLAFVYSSIFYDDFPKACIHLSRVLLFSIICLSNGILIVYRKQFNYMIKTTEENIESSEKLCAEDELVIKEYTEKGIWAAKLWLTICVIGGSLLICNSVGGTLYFSLQGNLTLVPIYDVTYPAYVEERKNKLYMSLLIFLLSSYYVVFIGFMYIGFNPLGPIFILQACGQIELVIRQAARLFKNDNIYPEDSVKNLKAIVHHVQNIYRFVDIIKQTHKVAYEMSLNTTAIAIPIACIGVIESYKQGSTDIQLISFVFGVTMYCYIPCYYCELLKSKGEDLRFALYGCGWERHWVPKTRSIILVMLTRTAHPLEIHAVFCTVGMKAFSDVCYRAYSIFNVMNVAWN